MQKLTLLSAFCAFATCLPAQIDYSNRHFLEIGLMGGISSYAGDLSEKGDQFRQSRPAFGFFTRYYLSDIFALKAQVNAGRIYGDDKNSEAHKIRQFRANGPLVELSTVLEFIPTSFGFENSAGDQYAFSPYLFGGIGGVYSKPQVAYYGPSEETSTHLKVPLPENGKAQRILLCTPFGLGMRFNIKKRTALGLEFGWRPVYSDLLDGVSKNGNPDATDWYFMGGFTASYYLGKPWGMAKEE